MHYQDFNLSAESLQQLLHESMVSSLDDGQFPGSSADDDLLLSVLASPILSPPAKRSRRRLSLYKSPMLCCLPVAETKDAFDGASSIGAPEPKPANPAAVHLIPHPKACPCKSSSACGGSIASSFPFVSAPPVVTGRVSPIHSKQVSNTSNKRSRDGVRKPIAPQFSQHQSDLWTQKYDELVDFYSREGHCNVPKTYGDASLARWVKRQRYQMKRLQEGRESTLNEGRISKLNEIGFVFDFQGAAWHARLSELKEFRAVHGHCNVPSNYPPNHSLAMWTKAQRRQFRAAKQGKGSFSSERVAALLSLGFEFEIRRSKH